MLESPRRSGPSAPGVLDKAAPEAQPLGVLMGSVSDVAGTGQSEDLDFLHDFSRSCGDTLRKPGWDFASESSCGWAEWGSGTKSVEP